MQCKHELEYKQCADCQAEDYVEMVNALPRYVIVCMRHRDMLFGGNAHLFWSLDSNGYTAALETAGLYTEEKAREIAAGTHGQEIPINIAELGLEQEFFRTAESGLKELSTLTIFNVHNPRNKEIIERNKRIYYSDSAG
ncbi:hypothetical protein BBD42_13000 [Paenibacillus sp. BIHB 4019]|uniref:Uncharacterized protein n=1 Tax=Paenibacillus sp. BIHB 4019 TaxID=1870819 RepID=A0A1B2DHU9_9BACL|nr:hypothetical protein [Paenibacillus sp. BIHB 4019]ANY67288.1 hypothetical protein BBD42_13000 [Paenibacillus sp. BIHB 4019]